MIPLLDFYFFRLRHLMEPKLFPTNKCRNPHFQVNRSSIFQKNHLAQPDTQCLRPIEGLHDRLEGCSLVLLGKLTCLTRTEGLPF